MKVIIHDLGTQFDAALEQKCDALISANGKYAPCQGCFNCWTKHPAECYIKDSLKEVCRTVGKADELIIISENCYGAYSPEVKNILDRSIGGSTPFSTYRKWQMHHTLRYGRGQMLSVIAYGDMTDEEKSTFRLMTERNAVNFGYKGFSFTHIESISSPEELII